METTKTLREVIEGIGVLHGGSHYAEEGKYCFLEAVSVWQEMPMTDDPVALEAPDVRDLNDGFCDDVLRTQQMLRLVPLVERWRSWLPLVQSDFRNRVLARTAAEIFPRGLHRLELPEDAEQFRTTGGSPAAIQGAIVRLNRSLRNHTDQDGICTYLSGIYQPGHFLSSAIQALNGAAYLMSRMAAQCASASTELASACAVHEYNLNVSSDWEEHAENEEDQAKASVAERVVKDTMMVDIVSIWVEECEKVVEAWK